MIDLNSYLSIQHALSQADGLSKRQVSYIRQTLGYTGFKDIVLMHKDYLSIPDDLEERFYVELNWPAVKHAMSERLQSAGFWGYRSGASRDLLLVEPFFMFMELMNERFGGERVQSWSDQKIDATIHLLKRLDELDGSSSKITPKDPKADMYEMTQHHKLEERNKIKLGDMPSASPEGAPIPTPLDWDES